MIASTHQTVPKGLLTIVLFETEVDIKTFLGKSAKDYVVVEKQNNKLLSLNRYSKR